MFDFLDEELTPQDESPIVELNDGEIDPRFLRLSYSGQLTLHGCPRKFQLEKLRIPRAAADTSTNVTFAFGHSVGDGIQHYLITRDLNSTLWRMYLNWEVDLFDENEKQKKSFSHAIAALMQFDELCKEGFLEEYEVAYFDGKPASELSFKINFGRTVYRGYVDLVLRHKITGEFLVLELKTNSGAYVNHYQYKNSAQALGYSVVLDKIAPGTNSYGVLYVVFMTKLERFEPFEFPKTYTQRALWLRDTIWDENQLVQMVETFGNYGIWPVHGEHCTSYGKTCEYMDICHMGTEGLMGPLRERDFFDLDRGGKEIEYQFEFTVEELLA